MVDEPLNPRTREGFVGRLEDPLDRWIEPTYPSSRRRHRRPADPDERRGRARPRVNWWRGRIVDIEA